MITYTQTFEIITPESAEEGEAAETGFFGGCEKATYRDMVDLLKGTQPSCHPLPVEGARVWYTVHGEPDYQDGSVENRSYHPATPRDGRYMRKAWLAGNRKA